MGQMVPRVAYLKTIRLGAGAGAVSVTQTSTGETFASTYPTNTITVSAADDAILFFLGCPDDEPNADSIKWKGTQSFTMISNWTTGGSGMFECWALLNPDAGTDEIDIDKTAAAAFQNRRQYIVLVLTGVDQTNIATAFHDFTKTQSTGTPISVNVPNTNTNGLAVACTFAPASVSPIGFSAPGGATLTSEVGWFTLIKAAHIAGTGSTITFTATATALSLWGLFGVAVKPA